ncbi:MAG: hypothetical protein ACXVRH_10025 [Thermoleophilaceae bacterium]
MSPDDPQRELEEATLAAYTRLIERAAAAIERALAEEPDAEPELDPGPCR